MRAVFRAVDEYISLLATSVRSSQLNAVAGHVRAAAVRSYLGGLLHGTGKLPPNAPSAVARDTTDLVGWCEGTAAPSDGSAASPAEVELHALDKVLELLTAEEDEFTGAFSALHESHADVTPAVAEALLNRRPEPLKTRKAALAACAALVADAGGDAPPGVFTALAARPAAKRAVGVAAVGVGVARLFGKG